MERAIAIALAFFALTGRVALTQDACGSLSRSVADGDVVDLAPPPAYTDVCAQDSALCRLLTAGYPPSVTTLAYLVPDSLWASYRSGRVAGFGQYLIAQLAKSSTPADLPGLKAHLRAQQGDITDHSNPPSALEVRGRAPLGIFDETKHSISFGVLTQMQPASHPEATPITLVATNSAVAIGNSLLSLYVFREYRAAKDIEAAKALTRAWISCLLGKPDDRR